MKKSTKSALIWGAVVLAIGIGFWGIIKANGNSGTNTAGGTAEITADDWVKGPADAKVKIVEYSDFQCPACKSYESILNGVLGEFGSHVQFAYRHFPLKSIHQNAMISAQASEAAGNQGKFWEMHDLIFEGQEEWSKQESADVKNTFNSYAIKLGLNTTQFNKDMVSSETKAKVEDAYDKAIDLGLQGTPTIFISGYEGGNPRSLEQFRTIIREQLEK